MTIYVAFHDIDFQRHIQNAFSVLTKDEDFLDAETNNQKEAIVLLSAAFGKAESWFRRSGSAADNTDYIRQFLYVGNNPPGLRWDTQMNIPARWDVQMFYNTVTEEVYSY